MRKVKFKELNIKDFRIYGSFVNMIDPRSVQTEKIGDEPIEFYRDMIQLNLGQNSIASFSVCRVVRRSPIINVTEYHSYCGELILPLDGDILMHVGPATPDGEIPLDKIEVFYVPSGTLVIINPGVWHHAPFTYQCDTVNILIGIPERTYANDCNVFEIAEEKQIEIEEK